MRHITFVDPCSDVLALAGSANNGRDTPQSATIIANCATIGVPVEYVQRNPQLSAISAGNSSLQAETSDNMSLGFVYNSAPDINWIEALTVSVDWYDVEIEDAIQGRNPGDVINACVNTLDGPSCDAVERSSIGTINLVNNRLQNIGGIEASGLDFALNLLGPATDIGQFDIRLNATYLSDYTEVTNNPDGTQQVTDLTGTITSETFQRAFPEWRATAKVAWMHNNLNAGLGLRWVDSMLEPAGSTLGSELFTDLYFTYNMSGGDEGLSFTVGANNVFDNDPAICSSCGSINMSTRVHDLPGVVGYVKMSYRH